MRWFPSPSHEAARVVADEAGAAVRLEHLTRVKGLHGWGQRHGHSVQAGRSDDAIKACISCGLRRFSRRKPDPGITC